MERVLIVPPSIQSVVIGLQVAVYVDNILWDFLIVLIDDIDVDLIFVVDNASTKFLPVCHNATQLQTKQSGDYIDFTKYIHNVELKKPVTHFSNLTNLTLSPRCHKHSIQLCMNSYLLSHFVNALKYSRSYRKQVITNLIRCSKMKKFEDNTLLLVEVTLVAPHRDVLDVKWNERIDRMLVERRELDHTMSWFSTLGGAFSALGEEFEHCAEMAGKISLQQMRIALHLGDPLTVARCKLYLALSQMQRGYLKSARGIVEAQFSLARSSPVLDERLVRMCQGVWAKLKYMYVLKHNEKCHRRKAC